MKHSVKKAIYITCALLVVVTLVSLFPVKDALAGTQTYVVPDESKPVPANLINGSFESPVVTTTQSSELMMNKYGIYTFAQIQAYAPLAGLWYIQATVPGWKGTARNPANSGDLSAHIIELQRPFGANPVPAINGAQYLDLMAEFVPQRIYQNIATTPGTRLCWRFSHNALPGYTESANFYIRPTPTDPDTAPTNAQLITTATDTSPTWGNYAGKYIVPAGQTTSEVSFQYVSGALGQGNYIDYVLVWSGSKLIAKKSIATSAADDSTAFVGETVTITVAITNWGEANTSRSVFRDVLSDGLEYVAGSAKINGVAAGTLATYNSTTDELRVNFGDGATAGSTADNGGRLGGSSFAGTNGTTGQGLTATISFQAVVTGPVGSVVKNQASVTYNDHAWESYTPGGFTAYSSVLGKTLNASDQTTYVNQFTIIAPSISGRVWNDTDYDSTIDAAESGVADTRVGLYATTDTNFANPVLLTMTDSLGNYTFTPVTLGTYKVAMITRSGTYVTGTLNDNKATAVGTRAVINPVSVTNTSPTLTGQNIGFAQNRSISGLVWSDADYDGSIDAAETGLSGLTVGLFPGTGTINTTPIMTTTTDALGNYTLTPITFFGTYKVAVLTPSGTYVTVTQNDNKATADGTSAVINAVTVSTTVPTPTGQNIGFAPNQSITGRVWSDADYDALIDSAEIGYPSMTVGIYANSERYFDYPIALTTTDASGYYTLPSIPLGIYKIAVLKPSGTYVTSLYRDNKARLGANGMAVIFDVTVSSSTAAPTGQNFGFVPNKSISGRVWNDADYDAIIDASENGLSALTVDLFTIGDLTLTTPVATTTTDEFGYYTLPSIPLGNYKVGVLTPSGMYVTLRTNDNRADKDGPRGMASIISVTAADPAPTNWNIGFSPYKSVSGRAFYDADNNGMVDASDTAYDGATVALYAASDTTFSSPALNALGNPMTITTNTLGEYTFSNVPSAAYQAVMTTPSGYQVTIKTASSDNDAVANGTRAVVSSIDLSGANPSVTFADFGFAVNPRSLTITKIVKGSVADPNQEFNFQVRFPAVSSTLTYTGSSTIPGVSAPAGGTISSGYGVVTLKHGQSITIAGVPYGTEYSIIEVLIFSGYSVTITETNGLAITLIGSSGMGGTLSNDTSLLFTNVLSGIVPTGIWMNMFPYALIAILGSGVLMLSLRVSRKKRRVRR